MNCRTPSMVALVAALVFLSAGIATAKKPVKPPPTPADSGSIYYGADYTDPSGVTSWVTYSMAPDGSDKTPLIDGGYGVPSQDLHWCATDQANGRWFLDVRPLEAGAYPNGVYRHELFAVSECGVAYQLTDATDIEPDHLVPATEGAQPTNRWVPRPRWADGDTLVSYVAKRWLNSAVVEWGFYVLDVDPEHLATHTAARPTWIPVVLPLLYADGSTAWSGGHVNAKNAWAPDGESFIYNSCLLGGGVGTGPLMRADYDEATDTWDTTQLLAAGHAECWAPVADRILVLSDGTPYSMDPYDATDAAALSLKPPPPRNGYSYLSSPRWSPSGTHIVFGVHETTWKGVDSSDVYVAPADGSDRTNLTNSDEREFADLLGWGGD